MGKYPIGRWMVWAGAIGTVIGLAVGFPALFLGYQGFAKAFLAAVPVAFLVAFTGLVLAMYHGPPPRNRGLDEFEADD